MSRWPNSLMNKWTDSRQTTIKAALEAGSMKLQPMENTRLDAELILSHVLNISRSLLYASLEEKLLAAEEELFDHLIEKRLAGIPVAYLTGSASFWSQDFKVCEGVLIPRPETELLVERCLGIIGECDQRIVADLGTGSGAIAGAISSEFPNARIIAVDNSETAIQIARENFKNLKMKNVDCIVSDWNSALARSSLSMIVSNPPYVSRNEINLIDREILAEPVRSIFAEENGLSDLKRIISTSGIYLKPDGHLLVEHGFLQGERVRSLFNDAGFRSVQTFKDLNKNERVTQGQKRTH